MRRAETFPRRDPVALIITRMAAIVGLLVAFSLPLFHLTAAFNTVNDRLAFKARIKATALSGLIASSPDLWMFAENQIQGVIAHEPVHFLDERVKVFDAHEALITYSGLIPPSPVWRSSFPLYDAGRVVGRLEVTGSLRGLMIETAIAAFFGALLGALVFVVMRVVPLRALHRVLAALVDEKERAQTTLNSIGDAVITTDVHGRVQFLNPTAERLTGWSLAEARELQLSAVFPVINADTGEAVLDPVGRVIAHGRQLEFTEHRVLLARDGRAVQIADRAAPIRNAGGEIVGVVLVFSDVGDKLRADAALHETQAILQAAMDQTPAGIAIANAPGGTLRYLNDAGLSIRGEDRNSVVDGLGIDQYFSSRPLFDLDGRPLAVDDAPLARAIRFGEVDARELMMRRADQSERIVMSRSAPIRNKDNEVVAGISIFLDITERKAAENEIRRLAFYDTLTGLPNRRLLADRLEQALLARSHTQREGALLFIGLDNFKTLNDTLGHDVGDLLLKQVAERLLGGVRGSDTVARVGGDEFVVMLESLSANVQEAASRTETVGDKILAALGEPYRLAGCAHHSTASIGVTLFGECREGVEELLKRADLAMCRAKAAGRHSLRFFDPGMQQAVMARAGLEADLHEAIRGGQFLLHYQAQVDCAGRVIGAEALLRWPHPRRGLVPPAEFIPLTEETGLILPIGQWVMETACAQLAAWAGTPALAQLTIAVNVSARQFHHRDFVHQVLAALERSQANPGLLKLELTESLLVTDVEDVIAKMTTLKARGVCFSLDDFGTGYSSLAYLKRLPLDQLKIDQSFVRDVLSDPNDAAIARTIVALGQSLGLAVIAEGVESAAQRDFLASNGCQVYQGYFFSRPLPVDGFEQFVQRR